MINYDVIIVGAGPAGLNCAYHLGDTNLKVLVLEQNNIIGPKVCAGGVTLFDIKYLMLPNSLIDNSFNHITIHIPTATKRLGIKGKFLFTIDRRKLGQWMSRRIRKFKNISIKTNSKVTSISDNIITLANGEKYKFKFLVGADGSCSAVRENLSLPTPKTDVDIAVQYIIPTSKYKNLELFFDSERFSAWYVWIFPHKDYVSIGAGCNPKYMNGKQMIANFQKWLKERKIDISKATYQAYPINYDYQGCCFGNKYLIGDAAGLASGLTGEGIHQALISGEEIAHLIIDKSYIPFKLNHIIRQKHIHNALLTVLEKSGHFREVEYELLLELLKIRFIDHEFFELMFK